MYPKDNDYREEPVQAVEVSGDGWTIGLEHGHLFVPSSPVKPGVGMTARLYPAKAYSSIRGLYLDGRKVYYRTAKKDAEHREVQLYGASAADWLERWDANQSVWSVEMGGLGPSYEQCIQIATAEVVRFLLASKSDASTWGEPGVWGATWNGIDDALHESPVIGALHLSGAQAAAASALGAKLYNHGPRKLFTDPEVRDRLIQVSKHWPSAA